MIFIKIHLSDEKEIELNDERSISNSATSDDDVPSSEAGAALMNLTGDALKIRMFQQVDYSREFATNREKRAQRRIKKLINILKNLHILYKYTN